MSDKTLELLERINVTLGAMRTVIEARGANPDMAEQLAEVDVLVRLNRELIEQAKGLPAGTRLGIVNSSSQG